jgi:predicted small lipoprotein YifL
MHFKKLILLLLSLMFVAACGQTGPLFLPGDPSAIRTTTPPQQQSEESEQDDEDETPNTNHN